MQPSNELRSLTAGLDPPCLDEVRAARQFSIHKRGIDRCLWLFPPEEWARISENLLTSISPFQQKARLLQRRIVAPAQEVEIDKAGRITVPQAMREFAGLQRDVVVLGIKKYIELWDAEELERCWELRKEEFQEGGRGPWDIGCFYRT